jgi:hypothetical protein
MWSTTRSRDLALPPKRGPGDLGAQRVGQRVVVRNALLRLVGTEIERAGQDRPAHAPAPAGACQNTCAPGPSGRSNATQLTTMHTPMTMNDNA